MTKYIEDYTLLRSERSGNYSFHNKLLIIFIREILAPIMVEKLDKPISTYGYKI